MDEVGAVSDRAPAVPNKCAALGRPAHRLRVGARDRTPKNSRLGSLTAVASAKVNHVFSWFNRECPLGREGVVREFGSQF